MKYFRTPLLSAIGVVVLCVVHSTIAYAQSTQSGSVGIEGTISTPAPTQAPTISTPSNGQVFSDTPISVSGICASGLLIKIFKNNVFAGSTECSNGSYTIRIDLFNGQNELIVRAYDALDQASPDSATVTVTFDDTRFNQFGGRVTLTSNFAKRGANPGETLTWPISVSSGVPPYAISIDWGDGKPADLLSQEFPGTFTMTHIYETSGVYNILIKATDRNGGTAFLQVVGVANGAIQETGTTDGNQEVIIKKEIQWWPSLVLFPLIFLTFWLGKQYEVFALRKRLEQTDKE